MFYMHHIQDWRKGVKRACDICHRLNHESKMRAWPVIADSNADFSMCRPMLELCEACSENWNRSVPGGVSVPVLQEERDLVLRHWELLGIKGLEKIWFKQFRYNKTLRVVLVGSEELANKYYSITFWDGHTRGMVALLPANQFSKEDAIKAAQDYAERTELEELE